MCVLGVGRGGGGSTGLHQNQAPSHKTFLCLHVNLQNMIKFFHTKPSDINLIFFLIWLQHVSTAPMQYFLMQWKKPINTIKKVRSSHWLIKIKTHKTTASPYIYSCFYVWHKNTVSERLDHSKNCMKRNV